MCLENALQVTILGHIGRPEGKVVPELSVKPIQQWFSDQGLSSHITRGLIAQGSGKLKFLENLRFDPREEAGDIGFAKELAAQGDIYINEAFASYRPSVSTTVLPSLLPHCVGLRFAEEVRVLTEARENPQKPFIAIMGGAKVADKLPVIEVLAKKADTVLVGGKLIAEIREQNLSLPKNVMVGRLTQDGFDIDLQTTDAWAGLISKAAEIVWNGPVGKFEDPKNGESSQLAKLILKSKAKIIIGGGDTITLLGSLGILGEYEEKGFVSTGGGAMLKLLADGTLLTIKSLN